VTTSSFECINANTLPIIQMIAGDEQDFTGNVYDSGSSLIDLNAATTSIQIFPYGDPTYNVITLEGQITGSPLGEYTATFASACSINLSGTYIYMPVIVDYLGKVHKPAQGKLVIFPSPNV